jgi:hypothetical protein
LRPNHDTHSYSFWTVARNLSNLCQGLVLRQQPCGLTLRGKDSNVRVRLLDILQHCPWIDTILQLVELINFKQPVLDSDFWGNIHTSHLESAPLLWLLWPLFVILNGARKQKIRWNTWRDFQTSSSPIYKTWTLQDQATPPTGDPPPSSQNVQISM